MLVIIKLYHGVLIFIGLLGHILHCCVQKSLVFWKYIVEYNSYVPTSVASVLPCLFIVIEHWAFVSSANIVPSSMSSFTSLLIMSFRYALLLVSKARKLVLIKKIYVYMSLFYSL